MDAQEEGPDELELNDLCAEFLRADTTTEAAAALGQRITHLTTACSAAADTAIPRQTSQHKSHLPEQSERVQQIKTDSGLEFSTAAEGRHKPPPSLYKCFIAHVEGGAAAHISSSMTSSWFDLRSEREGRDEEPKVPLCLVCGWIMNSWVFGSISLLAKVSLSYHLGDQGAKLAAAP